VENESQAQHVDVVLERDGTLTLDHLPFLAGDSLEVIIVPRGAVRQPDNAYPLRGTAVDYDRPFEPAAADDWDALQ
jgi:hypothetical protein